MGQKRVIKKRLMEGGAELWLGYGSGMIMYVEMGS